MRTPKYFIHQLTILVSVIIFVFGSVSVTQAAGKNSTILSLGKTSCMPGTSVSIDVVTSVDDAAPYYWLNQIFNPRTGTRTFLTGGPIYGPWSISGVLSSLRVPTGTVDGDILVGTRAYYFDAELTMFAHGDSLEFNCTTGELISGASSPAQPSSQVGMISISTAQAQPVYESAGGNVVRDSGGNELWLPQDYDGSGADTHLVMSSSDIDGRTWYEIWIGDQSNLVWVPADKVTVVE